MNKKKMVKMGASLALVGVVGVGATLAYLQTGVEDLTNTFTLGKGYPATNALILDEKYLGSESSVPEQSPIDKDRTMKGNEYTVNPGKEVVKDPQVSLNNESPNSYIFVGIKGEDTLGDKVTTTVNTTVSESYWKKVDGTGTVDGIYVLASNSGKESDDYAKIVETTGKAGTYNTISPKVFDKVKIENMDNTAATELANAMKDNPIKIYAVAVQADDADYKTAKQEAINALTEKMK